METMFENILKCGLFLFLIAIIFLAIYVIFKVFRDIIFNIFEGERIDEDKNNSINFQDKK